MLYMYTVLALIHKLLIPCLYYLLQPLGTVRIWQANTYRLESTLNYGLERVWSMAMFKGSNNVALGYDEGSILIKVCQLCDLYLIKTFIMLFVAETANSCTCTGIHWTCKLSFSLAGKSQPCQWIPMVKLFLPSTAKFNRLTLKMWLVSLNIHYTCTFLWKYNNLFTDSQVLSMFIPVCLFNCVERIQFYGAWIISGEYTVS